MAAPDAKAAYAAAPDVAAIRALVTLHPAPWSIDSFGALLDADADMLMESLDPDYDAEMFAGICAAVNMAATLIRALDAAAGDDIDPRGAGHVAS